MTCAHLACTRPRHSHGLCEAHWLRVKTGTSIATPIRDYTKHPPKPLICSTYKCKREQFLDLMCVRHWRADRLRRAA